jgi:DNA-binding PadR family transcriptional regulator
LIERRGYGYELVQRLSERLGSAWQLNPSAVYTALDQLDADGSIEPVPASALDAPEQQPERATRRAARVVYRATERGIAEFDGWMARPSQRVAPVRSELAMKVALVSPDSVPALLASIAHEEALILHTLRQDSAESNGAPRRGERWPVAASALVSAAAAARLQAELAWLGSVRDMLGRLLGEDVARVRTQLDRGGRPRLSASS